MTLHAIRSATGAEPTIILLHGFGSHEHDLVPLGEAVAGDRAWASLRAPLEMQHGGAAWFPITRPGAPDAEPVEAATAAIWEWIDGALGEDSTVLPIGFSQGGLMASQLLRTRPSRVAATVILGGFVLGSPQPADEELSTKLPRVFWGRGSDDQVIAPAAIERTSAWLPGHSSLDARVYPGLAHGIDERELADVRAFLDA